MPRPVVLGLFPHPDDEAYAAGAALAGAAEAGARVVIACATHGEAGRDRNGRVPPGKRMAVRRALELTMSCRLLGAEPPRWLGFPDGGLAAVADQRLQRRVCEVVDEVAPDVVVTLGRDGVYGHPDHVALTACIDQVVRARPEIRLLHAAFARGVFAEVWRLLQRFGTASVPLDALGTDRAEVDVCVPVAPQREVKLSALGAHTTQLHERDPRSFLRPGLVDALLDEEWFVHVSGPAPPPGATALLDGIVPR